MGYYKKLRILAEEGNRDAMFQIAQVYREREHYANALFWYSKVGKTKEVEEMTKRLVVTSVYEEDIF